MLYYIYNRCWQTFENSITLIKKREMKIKKVMIAGGGTLGSQIAWQTAFHGFNVKVYDVFEKGLETSKAFHKEFADLFLSQRGATQ